MVISAFWEFSQPFGHSACNRYGRAGWTAVLQTGLWQSRVDTDRMDRTRTEEDRWQGQNIKEGEERVRKEMKKKRKIKAGTNRRNKN